MSSYTVKAEISQRTGRKSYIARWDFIDGDGVRRHRKRSFKTKSAAQAHLLDIAKELKDRTYIEPTNEMTGVYLKRWAAELSGPDRGESTIHQYRIIVQQRFESISGIPLSALRRAHIERVIKRWDSEGLASHTMHNAFRVLRTALTEAQRSGLLQHNPSDGIRAPRKSPFNPTIWTGAQIAQFLDWHRGQPDAMLVYLIFKTVMREGEAAALNWSDIDLDQRVIHIRRTLRQNADGQWVVGDTPKSETSIRDFPIGEEFIERLRAHRADQDTRRELLGDLWHDHNAVFDRGNGQRISCAVIYSRWKAIMARQTIGAPLRVHDARHSGATAMINAGVPIKAVSQLLGHADVAFTMRLYVHPQPDDRRSAAAQLDRITQKRYDKRASGRIAVRQRAKKAPKSAA